jgi:tungstate transport system ATP-binding protein
MLYRLDEITKEYGSKTVLKINALNIEKGLIYGLLGPNGAGKTTLLKILGFLDRPTSGDIFHNASLVSFSETNLQPLRKKVVMLNQRPILFTTTVYKNLDFGLKIRKIPKQKRRQIIEDSLEVVGMNHLAQAGAHKLSGGETQRVALARAIALSPEVILCDEPTSSIDLENQNIIINLLKQINVNNRISIIFTTHDKQQASSLAHRTLFLDQGRLSNDAYENLFSGNVTGEGERLSVCTIQNAVKIKTDTDKKGLVRLLIDPEKIYFKGIEDKKSSGKSIIKGEIIHLAAENGKIRMTLRSEINLTILMSASEYKNRQPKIGEVISVIIPPESIRIL